MRGRRHPRLYVVITPAIYPYLGGTISKMVLLTIG